MSDEELKIDIYPVGWLAAILTTARLIRHRLPRHASLSPLRQEWSYTWRKIRKRDWHAVKCSLNGHLAEPSTFPRGVHRCGTGWTRRRALRDLERQMTRGAA